MSILGQACVVFVILHFNINQFWGGTPPSSQPPWAPVHGSLTNVGHRVPSPRTPNTPAVLYFPTFSLYYIYKFDCTFSLMVWADRADPGSDEPARLLNDLLSHPLSTRMS